MLSQSMSHAVPQTMFLVRPAAMVPQTMLSPVPSAVPQTMLSESSSEVPQTMLSQSASPQAVPQTMLSPVASDSEPHTVDTAQAVPVGLMAPLFTRRLPQRIVLLHAVLAG